MKKSIFLVVAFIISIATVEAKPKSVEDNVLHFGTYNVWGDYQRNSLVNKYKKAPKARLWEKIGRAHV